MSKKEKIEQPSFFKELGVYMEPYKLKYALSVTLSIVGVIFNILSFVFIGFIVNHLCSPEISWDKVWICLALTIVCKLLYGFFINTSTWVSHKAAYSTLKDIRLALVDKMMKLPMGYFEEKGSGRLKTLLVDHVENFEKTLAHMLPELTANLLVPLALMIFMFYIDWRLAFISFAWIIIGFTVTSGMMRNYSKKYQGQINALKGMNQSIVEYVNGIEVIKNFGREEEIYDKYKNAVLNHASYNIAWQKETLIYTALGMAIAPFTIFPVLCFGLHFYALGTLNAANLFMMCILTFAIFGPLMASMNYFDELAAMGTNAKEINEVLSYPELKRGELEKADDFTLTLNNVGFGYEKDKQILKNINLIINPGEVVALVGPSGSGKSTIGKLIAGYWDNQEGEIKLGTHLINEYSQDYLNKIIAYVDQDTFLFDKSIKDNIRIMDPTISDEEIIEASKKAGCHEFISKLKNGYDTLAGEAGNSLSGGEKQRISIVRAMMKNAPIMILDEATASTDPENEASIQKALLAAIKGKSLIVIAHRLYTIKNADKIVFVKDGEILKIGTHDELMQELEDYRKLYDLSEGKEYA